MIHQRRNMLIIDQNYHGTKKGEQWEGWTVTSQTIDQIHTKMFQNPMKTTPKSTNEQSKHAQNTLE